MKYTIILFFFFIALSVFSQQQRTDSLRVLLKSASDDIERVQLLNQISDSYKTNDPVQMDRYGQQALSLSEKIGHESEKALAYLNLGNACIISGAYAKALQYFLEAKIILEAQVKQRPSDRGLTAALAKAYGSIGIVFSEQSNYAKALQFHLRSADMYEKLGDRERLATVYNNIGIAYQAQDMCFKALQYFLKALEIKKAKPDESLGTIYTNIGNIYLKQRNFESAEKYYEIADGIFTKFADARSAGELLNNRGILARELGDELAAFAYWDKALGAFETVKDQFGSADSYLLIAETYFKQGNYQAALGAARKSLDISTAIQVPEQIALGQKLLSDIYKAQNNFSKALEHYTLYSEVKEKMEDAESMRAGIQAEMAVEFEKREALQKKELEEKELLFSESRKRHNIQLVFATLLAVLLCGIGFLIYSRVQLRKNLTLQKELAEYEQKALHLQMNPHFVFNCLGSISSFIVQNGTDEAIRYLAKFSKLMRLTLEYSKESLIPVDREIEGLQNYLELEQLRFNNRFDFVISKSSQIEDDMALPPLLLQPFVENAIIHGLIPREEQGTIEIDFSLTDDKMVCTIRDNGVGIANSQKLKEELVSVHKSMALDITKKRLQMMEALTAKSSHVEIAELKNDRGQVAGTRVVLTLPIQYITSKTS